MSDRDPKLEAHFTPVNEKDASVLRTCAELIIYTGNRRPSEVTESLNLHPTKTVSSGEVGTPNSHGLSRIGKGNAWFLSSENEVSSKDLRDHLDWLLRRLSDHRDALFSIQAWEGVQMYIYCPWWSRLGGGGPSLWPAQLRGIADLDLEFTIDFADYSDDSDCDPEDPV